MTKWLILTNDATTQLAGGHISSISFSNCICQAGHRKNKSCLLKLLDIHP